MKPSFDFSDTTLVMLPSAFISEGSTLFMEEKKISANVKRCKNCGSSVDKLYQHDTCKNCLVQSFKTVVKMIDNYRNVSAGKAVSNNQQ